jgi:hypothetical protein
VLLKEIHRFELRRRRGKRYQIVTADTDTDDDASAAAASLIEFRIIFLYLLLTEYKTTRTTFYLDS